jgi:hypothetical protein
VQGIAQACITNPDEVLHDLLRDAIDECLAACGQDVQRPAVSSTDAELAELLSRR